MDGDLLSGLPVHPLADLFPILPDDELTELADDIKANGLIHPLMLDHAGKMLVDGRNRLRACNMAGVEPRFERLAQDVTPAAYIASANLRRRNLTKGQQAMALAMIYPETTPGKRTQGSATTLSVSNKVSTARLSQARLVLRHSADELVPLVLSGAISFDKALAEIQQRQQAAQSEDEKLSRLGRTRPDLADKVREGELTLDGAAAQARREAEELKQQRWAITVNLIELVVAADRDPKTAPEMARLFDPAVEESKGGDKITPERLERAAAYLSALSVLWGTK